MAARIHNALVDDPEYPRLIEGCGQYNNDWTCMTGTLTVSSWDTDRDAVPLLGEALKALAIKAAVHQLTGDEVLAEIPVAKPVDEVMHAVLAQRTATERMAARCGFQVVHMTDTERAEPPYEAGDYTTMCYAKAYGTEPPSRYWLDHDEHDRRVKVIGERLARAGIRDLGHRHDIDFEEALPA
ncbi:hypothetical protein [Actinomadura harenae]|uniref:hypothetical protein n=1 Tax=Actinomadura harenae TaxID=2483351 RepID=UPI000EFBB92B|nr:hypothetical protein [Actinomadura harenae]